MYTEISKKKKYEGKIITIPMGQYTGACTQSKIKLEEINM